MAVGVWVCTSCLKAVVVRKEKMEAAIVDSVKQKGISDETKCGDEAVARIGGNYERARRRGIYFEWNVQPTACSRLAYPDLGCAV